MGSSGRIANASGLHYCVDCSTVLDLTAGDAAPSCPTCNRGTTWFNVRHSVESQHSESRGAYAFDADSDD
jgi:hypothetical protein